MKLKKQAKMLTLILAMVMLLTATAPASVAIGEEKGLERVELVMYLLGEAQPDQQLVFDKINELALRDLNCTVTFNYIPWADVTTQYKLIVASGEQVDLIYASFYQYYAELAMQGAFHEINEEILKQYMPLTWENQDPVAWQQSKVDGKNYMIPSNLVAYNSYYPVVYREDLRVKHNIPEIVDVDTLETYLLTIAENEGGMFGFGASQGNSMRYPTFYQPNNIVRANTNPDFIYRYDENGFDVNDVSYSYLADGYLDWLKKMKTWADAGVWSKNAISEETVSRDAFSNGKAATDTSNAGTCIIDADAIQAADSNAKAVIVDVTPDNIKIKSVYTQDGMCVPYTSRNWERALMLLDRLKFDREYYELAQYGIEGTHWIAEGDEYWSEGPDQSKYINGANCMWGLQSQQFYRIKEDPNATGTAYNQTWMWDLYGQWDQTHLVNPITDGFTFDSSSVSTEWAAINSLEAKYGYMLDLGLVNDVEATYNEFVEALNKAGYDRVIAEFRSQLQAWLDANT